MNLWIIAIPQETVQYKAVTDACDSHLKRILLQLQEDGTTRSMSYWSGTPTKSEHKLATTYK